MTQSGNNIDRTTTIDQENENRQPPKTTTTNDHHHHRGSSAGSSSPGARARAREAEAETRAAFLHGQYVDCCEYYTQSFRRYIPFVVQRELAERIRNGMSADVIRAAIDETQTAPRPSWAYTQAILRRCDLEDIRTLEDWRTSKLRFESSRNPALNYQQREYHEDEFGKDFFINLDDDEATPKPARKPAQEKRNPALNYAQREYRDEDFGEGFYFDVVAEYGDGKGATT